MKHLDGPCDDREMETKLKQEPVADGGGLPKPYVVTKEDEEQAKVVPSEIARPFVARLVACERQLASSQEALRAAREEMDFLQQLSKSRLPCGHLSSYGFTEDGGKTGYCTLCAIDALHERMQQVAPLFKRVMDSLFDIWDSDQDMKAGKWLRALSGGLPGYSKDIDDLLSLLSPEGSH